MRASRSAYEEAEMAERRREAGAWLRLRRETRGFTQRQLAERVGIEYYTFVSQIEAGRGRIPADRYQKWADALEIEPKVFVKKMLNFYEPITYQILFGETAEPEDEADVGEPVKLLTFPSKTSTLRF
jgi:transcriptional regulator with XRE-family HTH domain